MNIVIANSIGRDKKSRLIIHSPSRWSESVAGRDNWFAYYPWELAYLSALLKRDTDHRICFLDGCLLRLGAAEYRKRILSEEPDILIMESATRMIEENLRMALEIKNLRGTKLIFTGAHASAFPQELRDQGVDFVCVGEYEETVLDIVTGRKDSDIAGLYPNKRRELLDVGRLPWPEDDDVRRIDYAVPGEPSSQYREIQMYASRGCPGSCNFCVAGNLYYTRPNWRPRPAADVVAEIKHLRKKYPQMEGVFFDEEVHNGNKECIAELTEAICSAGLDTLHYEAMCDVRFLDKTVLKMMKRAGYYQIRIGIESASRTVLEKMGKNIEPETLREKLRIMKDLGLKTYGTFTFGAQGADREADRGTIELIRELIGERLLDNLQTSVCTPQPGTPFYDWARTSGYLRKDIGYADFDGGSRAVLDYPAYPGEEMVRMKKRAEKIRDHLFLKNRIRDGRFADWTFGIVGRYGWLGALRKALRRIFRELIYLGGKWQK